MDNANKIISFVLGLVVVIVFLAVVTGRFNLKSLVFLPLAKTNAKPTPTTLPKKSIISSVEIPNTQNGKKEETSYKPYNQETNAGGLNSIPKTGAPTIFIPIAISSLLGGIFLKKQSRKN